MKKTKVKYLRVTMPDGHRYDVPVAIIARSRAEHYAHEFDGDFERSLNEDTLPLFKEYPNEISDWAANNMNWEDVEESAEMVPLLPDEAPDFQEGWVNGDKEIVEK